MKLIKHFTTKDKKYFKYEIVIPNDKVNEAGLTEKNDLKVEVKDKKIIIKKI